MSVTDTTPHYALAQAAGEAALERLYEQDICTCVTCLVREVLDAAYDHLLACRAEDQSSSPMASSVEMRLKPSGSVHRVQWRGASSVREQEQELHSLACGRRIYGRQLTTDFPELTPRCVRCQHPASVYDATDQALAMASLHTTLGTEPANGCTS